MNTAIIHSNQPQNSGFSGLLSNEKGRKIVIIDLSHVNQKDLKAGDSRDKIPECYCAFIVALVGIIVAIVASLVVTIATASTVPTLITFGAITGAGVIASFITIWVFEDAANSRGHR